MSETESRFEVEQDGGFQLQQIKFSTITAEGNVLQVNEAEFMEKLSGRLNDLSFVELGANDPETLKQQKKGEGWTFICDSKIFVENHVLPAQYDHRL